MLHTSVSDVAAIFSDIDGTVVHYEKTMAKQGYRLMTADGTRCIDVQAEIEDSRNWIQPSVRHGVAVERVCWFHTPTSTPVWCLKVPSLTLGGGYISEKTLDLVDELRQTFGVKFVLMTGARTSTMLMRRQSATLPTTDFDVCEGGGKQWRRNGKPPAESCDLDADWTQRFAAVTGPMDQLDSDPLTRVGPLWDVFRILHAEGFHLDAKSFSTSFLVDLSKSRVVINKEMTMVEAEAYLKEKFNKQEDGLTAVYQTTYITNLGKGQVCPVGCNKRTALEHVAKQLEITDLTTCVALFDDENDLEFANLCGAGFIPGIAHDSVIHALDSAVNRGDHRWLRTPVEGPLGTDFALTQVLSFKRLVASKAKI